MKFVIYLLKFFRSLMNSEFMWIDNRLMSFFIGKLKIFMQKLAQLYIKLINFV